MEGRSINRTDLEPPQPVPTPNPDPILESYFRQRLEQLYADPSNETLGTNNGNEVEIASEATPLEQAPCKGEKAEYEFRLFAQPPGSSVDAQRIITLRSLSPAAGDGDDSGRSSSAVRRGRPDDYYFTGATSAELAAQYAQAAVSGQDIIDGLKTRWRGMELPWRVTLTIKTTGRTEEEEEKEESGVVVGVEHHRYELQTRRSGRKRSGKRRRVVIRRRAEKRAADEVAARRAKAEKEAVEREKRTRRNREKKVKRKRKDEVKKQMMVVDDGEGVG